MVSPSGTGLDLATIISTSIEGILYGDPPDYILFSLVRLTIPSIWHRYFTRIVWRDHVGANPRASQGRNQLVNGAGCLNFDDPQHNCKASFRLDLTS